MLLGFLLNMDKVLAWWSSPVRNWSPKVSTLDAFLRESFPVQKDQWEAQLKAELKLTDVQSKTVKKTLEGSWPTLSLDEGKLPCLTVSETWKKAAQTYVTIPKGQERNWVKEDLDSGVRSFFISQESISQFQWDEIQRELEKFERPGEIEVFLMGDERFITGKNDFTFVSQKNFITGKKVHDLGGNSLQELAHVSRELINRLKEAPTALYLGIHLDSQFFKNIARCRALRLLSQKILQETKGQTTLYIVGLTSYREWTLYERYSNMLRNSTAVASGLMGGCDYIQSSGYQTVFELEGLAEEDEHKERSRRMSRNTSHILALESMLGMVQDPAFGSFHLDSLTTHYCEKAWTLMQEILPLTNEKYEEYLQRGTLPVREGRMELVKTRKHVMAGMNDFPNTKDVLGQTDQPRGSFFRTASLFEKLRMTMESSEKKPQVYVALYGDYAALNARMNFVKNYFELLGLVVHEPGHSQMDVESFKKDLHSRKEEIIVVCTSDDNFAVIQDHVGELSGKEKFIAGKNEIPGFKNLYAGQNVYEVLENLVKGVKV